jgi:hypothetical protein
MIRGDSKMPERDSYQSIEEVRSAFYPRSAGMLDLEKDEVLEFPTGLAESLQALANIAKRPVVSETELGDPEEE